MTEHSGRLPRCYSGEVGSGETATLKFRGEKNKGEEEIWLCTEQRRSRDY